MKKSIIKKIICTVIALTMVLGSAVTLPIIDGYAYAADSASNSPDLEPGEGRDFAGGKGTIEEPFLIANVEQMMMVKHYLKSGYHFKLMNDLYFNSYEEFYGDQWVAIGTDASYFAFQGVFDGNGKTIHNLNVTSSATTGLFGFCSGTIKNLKVEGFNINTTGQTAGAIVGVLCPGGVIDQCAADDCTVVSAHNAGGIAGVAYHGSKITNVYTKDGYCSNYNLLNANRAEDGLLGGGENGINDSLQAVSEIWGQIKNVLQLIVGDKNLIDGVSTVLNSATMQDYRTSAIGGVVGFLSGDISGAFSTYSTDWFNEWYQIGSMVQARGINAPYIGMVAGRNFYGTMEECYAYEDPLQNWSDSLDYWIDDEEVTRVTTFSAEEDVELNRDYWDVTKRSGEGPSVELKVFQGQDNNVTLDKGAKKPWYNENTGFYEIKTPQELEYIEYEGWSSFELMNDIFLTPCSASDGTAYYQNQNGEDVYCGVDNCIGKCVDWGYWAPLCREKDNYFDGEFDGNGHTIYGLNVSTNDAGGLFGYILGSVHDLNIRVGKIDAFGPAGGLAAGVFYRGSIERCSVVGPNGLSFAKGNSSSTAWDINGGGNEFDAGVGGLVGVVGKDVMIKDCYACVNVENSNFWKRIQEDYAKLIWDVVDIGGDGYSLWESTKGLKTVGTSSGGTQTIGLGALAESCVDVLKGIVDTGFNWASLVYDSCIGGLIGECAGEIVNCYSAGYVNDEVSGGYDGGLVGRLRTGTGDGKIIDESKMVRNSYYLSGCGAKGSGYERTSGVIAGIMNLKGFAEGGVWTKSKGDYSFPILKMNASIPDTFGGGKGTAEEPFIINNYGQFLIIDKLLNEEYYYQLNTDIEIEFEKTTDWFGGVRMQKDQEYRVFNGHFDGNGKKITVSSTMAGGASSTNKYAYAGLFPMVSGSISNLEVVIDNRFGDYCQVVGGLVGDLLPGGLIENVAVKCKNNITGEEYLGGLAGRIYEGAVVRNSMVEFSNNMGLILGTGAGGKADCGLLAGKNDGTVECAFVKGRREGEDYVFIGLNNGTAKNTYYTPNDNNKNEGSRNTATRIEKKVCRYESRYDGFDFNHVWTIDYTNKELALKNLDSTYKCNYGALLGTDIAGTGTESDPFIIDSVTDLEKIKSVMNDKKIGFRGVYFKQEALTLSSITESSMIGTVDVPFGGVYDGNNQLIITNGYPLFDALDGAIIKNCNVRQDATQINYVNQAKASGILAGLAENSLILNCTVKCASASKVVGRISNDGYYGGIVGRAVDTSIINCLDDVRYGNNFAGVNRTFSNYNGSIVGLDETAAPILVNCLDTVNVDPSKIQDTLDELNKAQDVPDQLRDQLYTWNYNSSTGEIYLSPGVCTVTLTTRGNVEILRIRELDFTDSKDEWKPLKYSSEAIVGGKEYTILVHSGREVYIEAVNTTSNENKQIVWEVRDEVRDTDTQTTTNTYYHQADTENGSTVRAYVNGDLNIEANDGSNEYRHVNGLEVSGSTNAECAITQNIRAYLQGSNIKLYAKHGNGTKTEVDWNNPDIAFDSEGGGLGTDGKFTSIGDKEVTVRYGGHTANIELSVVPREIVGLQIKTLPTKTSYHDGETLNLNGGWLTVSYNDNTSEDIAMTAEGVTASGFSAATAGDKTIYLGYEGQIAKFTINVPRAVSSIQITTNPSKSSYVIGQGVDAVDLSGGKLLVNYNDGTTMEVDMTAEGVTVESIDSTTCGANKPITVKYDGKTASYNVTVTDTMSFNTAQNGFVKKGDPNNVQSSSLGMLVKNNGTGNNTRRAYIKFDLSQLKNQLEAAGLEIESANLIYNAKVDRAAITKTVHLKEAEEKSWTNETLKWNNAPAVGELINSSQITGIDFTKKTVDVSTYINNCILSGNTATFAFEVGTCDGECIIVADSESIAPKLEIKLRKITTKQMNLLPGNSLIARYNMGVQAKAADLLIKNNGDNNTYSRRGYVQYNLATVKEQIRLGNMTVKKAELLYYASTSSGSWNLQLRKVTSEKNNLDQLQWSGNPSLNTAPGLDAVLNSQTINSSTPRIISVDVTDYVRSRINGNTVTFGFATNQTTQGSTVKIPVMGDNAAQLIITLE